MQKRIVILASGGGSNAKAILAYFQHNKDVVISTIISNKSDAGVHDVAEQFGVPSFTFNKESRMAGEMQAKIKDINPDLIILAGYLLKIPSALVESFPGKIINIHPALLPKYGGKGMYGMNVHRAVVEAGEQQSGITIHFVNENYDEGQIVKQVSCNLDPDDSAEVVQQKVLRLEHEHYPQIIEDLISA